MWLCTDRCLPVRVSQEKVYDRQAFQSKRQIAGIAQDRHFSYGDCVNVRNRIFPMDQAVRIPHFPKPSANQGGQSGQDHGTPVPFA